MFLLENDRSFITESVKKNIQGKDTALRKKISKEVNARAARRYVGDSAQFLRLSSWLVHEDFYREHVYFLIPGQTCIYCKVLRQSIGQDQLLLFSCRKVFSRICEAVKRNL